jgi:competence protein ComEA
MGSSKNNINWTLVALLLVLVIIAGIVVLGLKCRGGQAVEVTLLPGREITGTIYVGGAVNNPGYYPIFTGDTLEDVIAAAGGFTNGASVYDVELSIGTADEGETPQKIDINRAEAWLLDALPGIGQTTAQVIVDYRRQHGFFRDIYELLNVPGIGESTFNNIKDLITVNE